VLRLQKAKCAQDDALEASCAAATEAALKDRIADQTLAAALEAETACSKVSQLEGRLQLQQSQISSMQEQCKAHVEACRHEAGRLEKFKSFLEEDAAEQAARAKLPWAHSKATPEPSLRKCAAMPNKPAVVPEGEVRSKHVISSTCVDAHHGSPEAALSL